MIDYEKTKAWRSDPVRHTYTERDTILYALGVGFAADPLVLEELRFVYEKELQAVPTMAAVLASPGFWMRDRKELGIDYLEARARRTGRDDPFAVARSRHADRPEPRHPHRRQGRGQGRDDACGEDPHRRSERTAGRHRGDGGSSCAAMVGSRRTAVGTSLCLLRLRHPMRRRR